MSLKLRSTLTLAFALTISACGGGGSSGPADTTTTSTQATTTTTTTATTDTTTTTTVATGTTTTTTTSSTLLNTNYLYLVDDTISFNDGFLNTPYTLAQFQSVPGITVKWPLFDIAALSFTLADGGGFNIPAGQTLSAAASFVDVAAGSQGVVKLYVNGVTITQQSGSIVLTVPAAAVAWAYGVATDGSGAAITNLSSTISNATGTFSTVGNVSSQIVLGSALNSAIGTTSMSGTYKVTLVVTSLPLRKADQTPLSTYTISVPKSLADTSNVTSITGMGLEGYITLVPR